MEQHHFDIVNHATPRLESMDKALGRGKYTDDLELPNMAYAALVRCPYSHAKVLSIDVSEAEKVPGYLGCALLEEAPQAYFNCSGNPPSPLLMADEKVLTTEPLTIGDRVAVVAAETEEAARAAAEAVKVEYENLAPILDVKAALADNAPAMQPHLSGTNVVQRREVSQGDIAMGEEKSDIILKDHFVTLPMQHTMIELTCCICDFSGGEHMTIYSCSQTVFQERRILAELFGLKEVDVHIIKPLVGAGFGARQQLHAQHAAALISRKIKRPVKLLYSREEDFYSVVRHASDVDLRIGADKNGKLQLFDTTFRLNAGPYTTHTPTVVAAAARKLQYNVPNYSFIGLSVFTNHVTGGAVVMLNADASVHLLVGSADIGQGSETMESQIAAECLGIPLSSVQITAADTSLTPYNTGTFGSSQTFICGNAVKLACDDLKKKMVEQLKIIYDGCTVKEKDHRYYISGGEELELSFEDAARKILFDPKGSVPIGAGTYKAAACPNPFSVCFVKAEYHKKLNAIRLMDIIEVVDVGTPINRLTVAGQLEGGIAQGVGYALYERMEINLRSRRTLSTDFLHYRIPQMGDMPRTYVDMVNSHDPYGPHGAKSVGELATVPVAPAIVNAVRRASGIEINSLPLCDKFAILPTERGNVK